MINLLLQPIEIMNHAGPAKEADVDFYPKKLINNRGENTDQVWRPSSPKKKGWSVSKSWSGVGCHGQPVFLNWPHLKEK